MTTLAIDTCDQRGSVTSRLEGHSVGLQIHGEQEYSSWLLPAVDRTLAEARKSFADVNLLAVATGPGSFTGVRIGLCAVKAWSEVYGIQVVGVSRLEALARSVTKDGWVAASYDAHRGQLYAGLYHRACGKFERRGEDQVIAPDDFLTYVREQSGGSVTQWVSLDPNLFVGLPSWQEESSDSHPLWPCVPHLANSIGEIAEESAARGEFADVLELDANYVRRSDAEIFWKGPADRAR